MSGELFFILLLVVLHVCATFMLIRCEAQGSCAGVFYIFLSCLCKFQSQKYTTLPGLVIQC